MSRFEFGGMIYATCEEALAAAASWFLGEEAGMVENLTAHADDELADSYLAMWPAGEPAPSREEMIAAFTRVRERVYATRTPA